MSDTHAAHAAHAAPKHPYHLVDPSPWPLVGAIAARRDGRRRACSIMHGHGWALLIIGALVVLGDHGRVVARRDPRGDVPGLSHPVVQIGMRYGMALFIASEVMFFAAFFWAFFTSSLFPVGGGLAAQGHPPVRPVRVPVPQHADPAAVGHDGDLGASFAARRQPQAADPGPDA